MISDIHIEITPIEEAVDAILEATVTFFLQDTPEEFIHPLLETNIAKIVDELNENIYCFIEYPYVDKVYRDSYYNYYASKHYTYQRDCIRVSLFDCEIKQNDFLDEKNHQKLRDNYLGYFVIRPTINALIGRSIIDPKAFIDNGVNICNCKTSTLVYGVKLDVEGFPYSSQDGESIKCAETTIWAIMEYFGTKYPDYKPALPGVIHITLKSVSVQRQLPSNGLTMDQISFALREFGFGTRIYSFDPYDEQIYSIVDSYVESGIPVIIGLESKNLGHVVICIGKKNEDRIDYRRVKKRNLRINGSELNYYSTSDIPSLYVIQDDNLIPYRLIDLMKPGEHYDDDESKAYTIDSVVVPLYPKIYLESVVAKSLALEILKDTTVGYQMPTGFVFRFYLTSSRSFKRHIGELEYLDKDIKNSILITKMPKFIWISEFYNKTEYKKQIKKALALIVLDATEANRESIDALIFAGYPDRCVCVNENNFVTLHHRFENYRYYSNLK
ncbi:MAG: hypothetical protein RL308_402 [Bacteroidota bacterium]|jgi:hypothetical protein